MLSGDSSERRVAPVPGMPANPWVGNDVALIVAVREAIDGPAAMADGPPAGVRELAYQRARLAEGVEAAYLASYETGAGGLVTAYGLKFAKPPAPVRDSRRASVHRTLLGAFVITHRGDGSECHKAVAAHLASFGK
jgi:hypothetical protein